MRTFALWILVICWFLHLAIGAAAGFAALRIWACRADKFALRLIIALHAPMISSLSAIALVFLAKGVKLTWKFSIAWFAATLLADAALIPLLLTLIKGLKEDAQVNDPTSLRQL